MRLQGFGEFDGGFFVAGAEQDVGTLAHEGLDDGAAQSLAASGDDRVAVGEFHRTTSYAAGVPTAKYSTQGICSTCGD